MDLTVQEEACLKEFELDKYVDKDSDYLNELKELEKICQTENKQTPDELTKIVLGLLLKDTDIYTYLEKRKKKFPLLDKEKYEGKMLEVAKYVIKKYDGGKKIE